LGASKLAIFLTVFVHERFGEPDGPKFEGAIAKLRKRPEQAFQAHPGGCFAKIQTFVKGGL
jgi:hypothetical protein